ncbi:MAG: AI-2E family transporter [Sedimentisphaerales bacterium]|nr:AI-2E family transporter [Sedimentisphaerales bacterium]
MRMFINEQRIEQVAGIILIAAIVIGCALVLKPFAPTILWAAILCFVTWPLRELLMKWLNGRRTLTAALMTIILLLVLFVPFFVVGLTLTDSVSAALQWLETSRESGLIQPPDWVARIPFAGPKISEYWTSLAEDAEPAFNQLKPWLRQAGLWLLKHSIDFAQGIFSFAISILIAFFLYRDGQGVIDNLNEAFRRISGDYAKRLFDVVKKTIYSVVYGAIGTALAQGLVAGIGFAIAGVPSPMLLGILTFCLSFIPVGPPVVWISAAVWLFSEGHPAWGVFMVVYGFICISSIDNLIKPYIISRGSKLSFIITLIGVLGGVAAFGVIGVFLGPVLLAVGYNLAHEILSHPRSASTT